MLAQQAHCALAVQARGRRDETPEFLAQAFARALQPRAALCFFIQRSCAREASQTPRHAHAVAQLLEQRQRFDEIRLMAGEDGMVDNAVMTAKPLNYQDYITIDPSKRGGKPCVRDLRITVYEVSALRKMAFSPCLPTAEAAGYPCKAC